MGAGFKDRVLSHYREEDVRSHCGGGMGGGEDWGHFSVCWLFGCSPVFSLGCAGSENVDLSVLAVWMQSCI